MPFIPVPNCCQVELVYTWAGQTVENVLHYTKASPWDLPTMGELAAGIATAYSAAFAPVMPTTVTLINIRCTDLSSQTGPVLDYGTGLPIVGESAAISLPNNCALVITKRTALRGRSYRGRIYQLGLTENSVTDNTVSSASVAVYLANWNSLNPITLTADEAIMVVVSRFENNAPRTTGVATPVTNFTTDGQVDSQRRRLPGRGA